jgi:hypothetical protein
MTKGSLYNQKRLVSIQSVNPPERVNLSYEVIELIYSHEWRGQGG